MKIRVHVVGIVGFSLGLVSLAALADEDTGHHQYPHHHVALFVGAGIERDDNDHEESGSALGLEYEIQFSKKWGVGLDLEYLSGSSTQRSWVAAVPLSYHPSEKWRLFMGPGMEFDSKENKYLMRVGVAYEIPFHRRWVVSPEILVDFIEGGATTYVLGLSVGYGF